VARTQGTLEALAARQHGLVTLEQAAKLGSDRKVVHRLVRSWRLERVFPGVYRIVGAPETDRQRLFAALLWGGDDAVASHRTAARLWRLDGEWGDGVEITVPFGRKNERVPGISVHRTRRLHPRDRRVLSGFPVTGVERTLIDLSRGAEEETLEVAMESAVRMGRTSPEALWRGVDRNPGRRGLRKLRWLLIVRQPEIAYSRWEVKLLRLIRRAGLPEPVRQFKVWDGTKWRKIDLAYPELRIALEYDSYTWHSGRKAWERDHTRNADLIALGWRVLPITLDDVDLEPARTIDRIVRLRRSADAA